VGSWSLTLPRRVRLQPGLYTLTASAGNVSDSVTFRVR
jgi:hypothetical protein